MIIIKARGGPYPSTWTFFKTIFQSEIEEVVLYVVLTYGAHQNWLCLGSEIEAITVGRPSGHVGKDAPNKLKRTKIRWQNTQREQAERAGKNRNLKRGARNTAGDHQRGWGWTIHRGRTRIPRGKI